MLDILTRIGAAQAAGQLFYVSQAEGQPLMTHNPQLIAVDGSKVDPNDGSKIAAILTEAGARMVSEAANGAATGGQTATNDATPVFEVEAGFVAPPVKRRGGGGGAPTKYPFETLQVGQHFFVADDEVESKDALKTLSSAVGSANQRFAVEKKDANGAVISKTVERAKRGEDRKAVKGPDGKNVMETVTITEKEFTRKFSAVAVKAGEKYGNWQAPSDGAVALRKA